MTKKNHPKGRARSSGGLPSGIISGKVVGHRDGYGFVVPDSGDQDLFVSQREMRKVFHGDRVRASIVGMNDRGKLEGRIEEVLESELRQVVGQFCFERGISFVRPDNKHIAIDVFIPDGATGGAKSGQIVVAEIVEQPSRYAPPIGKVVEVLGDHMSPGLEIEVAIRSAEIPNEWPQEVVDQADKLGARVKSRDKENRFDYRTLPFVTIDGEDARDFDDAVYCEKQGSGWQLMVAIADVSHYVRPDSPLDAEAGNRGTSVYFPDYVVPMLPEVLSNGLCSLKPKVDRLALVCCMQINELGHVTSYYFSEAIIRSHERLTYTRVQNLLDGDVDVRKTLHHLVPAIEELHKLFRTLNKARQLRGAMDFDSTETRILFDENRKIDSIVPLVRKNAHRLIEECMLCANICAANLLQEAELPALYRVHMHPKTERLEALRDYLTTLGLWLGGGDMPAPADFKKLADSLRDRPDRAAIEMMILRSQQQAVYQPDNAGHFGLAYPAYAHFTSPIRRYPDLLVHRAIRSLIRGEKSVEHTRRVEDAPNLPRASVYPYGKPEMSALGEHCSKTERRAEEATRDVEQWLKCEYLSNHMGSSFPAIVATVTGFGMFVQLEELFIEGLVHISVLPADYYDFDSSSQILIGQKSRRTFKMGDKVQVLVSGVSLDDRKIDFVLDTDTMGIQIDNNDGSNRRRERSSKGKKTDFIRSSRRDKGSDAKSRRKPSSRGRKKR